MNYQPSLRIDFSVDTIPEPRRSVRRHMLAASMLVDGPVNTQPERVDLSTLREACRKWPEIHTDEEQFPGTIVGLSA